MCSENPRSFLELLSRLEIGLVPHPRYFAPLPSREVSAARLHAMRAVAEATSLEQRAHFREAAVQLTRIESPHTDFAQAGRVDHVARVGQRVQIGPNGRVSPLHD